MRVTFGVPFRVQCGNFEEGQQVSKGDLIHEVRLQPINDGERWPERGNRDIFQIIHQ